VHAQVALPRRTSGRQVTAREGLSALGSEAHRRRCDPVSVRCGETHAPTNVIFGQDPALDALGLSMSIRHSDLSIRYPTAAPNLR